MNNFIRTVSLEILHQINLDYHNSYRDWEEAQPPSYYSAKGFWLGHYERNVRRIEAEIKRRTHEEI